MEIRDLYDVNRLPTGLTGVRGEEPPEGCYHTVIHICIFNSEGKMLIQQRQSTKAGFPDMWDVTCGGCSVAGETSRGTAHRELKEELGLDLSFENIRPNLTVNFDNGFDDFYLINRDIDLASLTLQAEEVQAVRWASLDEIFTMIDDGSFIPFFKSFVQLLFDIRSKPDCLDM